MITGAFDTTRFSMLSSVGESLAVQLEFEVQSTFVSSSNNDSSIAAIVVLLS